MKKQIVCALAATMALGVAGQTTVSPVDAKAKAADKVVKKKKTKKSKKTVEKSYAQKFVDAYCSLQILDEDGNFNGNTFVIEAVTKDNYGVILAGMTEYESLDDFIKSEINGILSSITAYATYDDMYAHALEIFEEISSEKEDETDKEDLQEESSTPESNEPSNEQTTPENDGALDDENSKDDADNDETSDKDESSDKTDEDDTTNEDETLKEDVDEEESSYDADEKDDDESVKDETSKEDVDKDESSKKDKEEISDEDETLKEEDKEFESKVDKEVKETLKTEEIMPVVAMVVPVEETKPLLQTALETSVSKVEDKVEPVIQKIKVKQEKQTTKKSTAQNFIDTYLTASTGSIYAQATSLNYKNILSSLSSWNKLTSTQRNDVNAILNKQIGKTYQNLLKEAQTIQFNGVPSTYTNNPTKRVNTATENNAGLYGALMGLSIAFAGFIFKKRKEEN